VIRVLVVDDSALVRKLFGAVLGNEEDMEVRFARNGLEALAQLEPFKPNVVTLDVHMPAMNGLACLDRIMLEHPCPVLMVSSLTAEGAEETLEALRLGAVDFVEKPEGAVSIHMAAFAPTLIEKIRAAAKVKVRRSRRLRERLQHRAGTVGFERRRGHAPTSAPAPSRAAGDGLVLVGTSTGGPPALEALLKPLPASFPWPILVAQHMPASFTGPLARRLDGLCNLRVIEVQGPALLEPGHAYIGRGDADLIVSRRLGGLAALAAPAHADYLWHPSADRLVRSAMEYLRASQLIGVLMTGMGYDGAGAMAQLHADGGKTIAEAEETAVIWGMPGELVKLGGADLVLPLSQIAIRLQELVPAHAADS
jgi:two-component system chemotaxis response regulator CheB